MFILALDVSYPDFQRQCLQWGFFREYYVQSPVVLGELPSMKSVGVQGDYSLALVGRFEMVALNKKINVFGGGRLQTLSVGDPHLVRIVLYRFLYSFFVLGYFTYHL